MEATREIMWMIPYWMKVLMYLSLAVAAYYFVQGFMEKFRFVTNGKNWKQDLFPKKFNFENFLRTIFFQGKVQRDSYVGVYHTMLFYGFVVLFIATELVAIHADTPFKVFKGTTYIVVSFLADIAGLFVLLGLGLAYYRRYVRKPQFLSATRPNQEKFMYGMLAALVIIGFLLEGIRIFALGMPEGEKLWSPVGYALASLMGIFPFTEQVWAMSIVAYGGSICLTPWHL